MNVRQSDRTAPQRVDDAVSDSQVMSNAETPSQAKYGDTDTSGDECYAIVSDRSPVWEDILRLSKLVDAYLYAIDRDKLEKKMTGSQLRGIQKTLTGLCHRLHKLEQEALNGE